MANDYVAQVAASIIEQLRQGTAPWQKPWAPGERFMPYNPTTGNEYRGMNAVWLMSRGEFHDYGDARWMTYRQAQAQGAQVRKREKGTVIQFWKWDGLESVRDADGNPVLGEDGEPVRRAVRYERPRVWSAVVFNAAQIDGLPAEAARPAMVEWERHEKAEAILTRSGATIRHLRGDRAFYRLAEDMIVLPERGQFASGDRYYATALHELGHWTGHPSRLNRDIAHPFGSEAYAREELRAEIASLMLGEQLGIGHDPAQHVAYLASWIRALESDPREIFRAAADAERIAKLIRTFEREQERQSELESSGRGAEQTNEARAPVLIQENHPAMTTSHDRTYLAVPYEEKNDAKALGARWDRQARAWYVPAGMDLEVFGPWLPARGQVHIAAGPNAREAFTAALHESALQQEKAARTGTQSLGAQDRARMAAEAAQGRQERAVERERQYERTAQEVEAIWAAATPVEAHPYLAAKGIASYGLRQGADGQLLIPVQDANGKTWSVQQVSADGSVQFCRRGRIEGGHYVIGDARQAGPLLITEGYAAAATLHELSGMPTVVAFTAGNLASVAQTYRALYPERTIYIASDNVHGHGAEPNRHSRREGVEKIAAMIGGSVLVPSFASNGAVSDWNDLMQRDGRDHARQLLHIAIAIAEREQMVDERAANRREQALHTAQPPLTPNRLAEMEFER